MTHTDYLDVLVNRFRRYADASIEPGLLEGRSSGPPVFRRGEPASRNVLVAPGMSEEGAARIRTLLPVSARHRWFRSMRSSQALAQTVFGNLIVLGKLHLLSGIVVEDGEPVFVRTEDPTAVLEHQVDCLGEKEGRQTSVDVLFTGDYRVAVECKLSEGDVGTCSRPDKDENHPGFCDGSYRRQKGRSTRCALTELEIAYWDYLPAATTWRSDTDHDPCPLRKPYQLARNVLAACVRDGGFDPESGHAVLLFDERNPAFTSGAGHAAYSGLRDALRSKRVLKRCSWQDVMKALRADPDLSALCDLVHQKYGL